MRLILKKRYPFNILPLAILLFLCCPAHYHYIQRWFMMKWLDQYNEASPQIKYLILNWLVYGLVIIITTVYCYARLDFVRSYQTPSTVTEQQSKSHQ